MKTNLDDFTKAYIICALWSTNDESDDSGGEPLENNYSIEDISPETLDIIIKDCKQFQEENKDLLALAKYNKEWPDVEMQGHDFWLTRNGHGSGFWDGDLGEVGDKLTEACKKFGEVNLYVGDNGLIYL